MEGGYAFPLCEFGWKIGDQQDGVPFDKVGKGSVGEIRPFCGKEGKNPRTAQAWCEAHILAATEFHRSNRERQCQNGKNWQKQKEEQG